MKHIIFITLLGTFLTAAPAFAFECSYNTDIGARCEPIEASGNVEALKFCEDICAKDQAVKSDCVVVEECRETFVGEVTTLKNPIRTGVNFASIVGIAVKRSLAVIGAFTLAVFVYGGFRWLTSGGSEEKVRAGSAAMMYAAIGIFIILGSYAILSLIFGKLGGA